MITARLYTDYAFNNKQKAAHFFHFLQQYPSIFDVKKFGLYQPLKHAFIDGDNEEAINMLSGYDVGQSGDIFLKGKKYKSLCWIRWCSNQVTEWTFWFDDSVLRKAATQEKFLQFMADLSFEFKAIFGGIATEDEWRHKHWKIISYDDGGETLTKKGLYWEGSFTGLYWITIFGEHLFDKFIKNNHAISLYTAKNLSKSNLVTLIKLDVQPFNFESQERIKIENALRASFGNNYFFDIRNEEKKLDKVEW